MVDRKAYFRESETGGNAIPPSPEGDAPVIVSPVKAVDGKRSHGERLLMALRRNASYKRSAVFVVIPGTVCSAAFANAAESCGSNCSKTDSILIRTVVTSASDLAKRAWNSLSLFQMLSA